MKRLVLAVLVGGVLLGPTATIVRAQITPEQVQEAIKKAVRFLEAQQRADGSWADYRGQPGAVTSLCTLALLNAGVLPDDPKDEHVKDALKNLERYTTPQTTYATSLQTMVLCLANPKQYSNQIKKNVDWLEATQLRSGPNAGSWSYPGAVGDNSNSQFALLALHDAEVVLREAGVPEPVKRETWARAKTYWENCQNINGSWGYHKGIDGTGSMTCAGIAALIITGNKFREPNAKVEGDQILCCQQAAGGGESDRIQRGLGWLGRNFSVTGNPGAPGQLWLMYYLYGVERVGRLTAQRFFYTAPNLPRDWYREGADHLVRRQDGIGGFWLGIGHVEQDPVVSTALGLLFLSKGRRPVLMAKLQHSLTDDWNQHRSDVDNLTRHVETLWRRDLTWQVIDLRAATVEDLLQAPVLYFCGNLDPLPAAKVQQEKLARKLRDYLDRGGFLFAEGLCSGGKGFDQGFRELMTMVFPEPEYRLRLLEPEHPIWKAEKPVPPDQLRPLLGIEFGCRTSVIYAPPDPPERPRPSLSCLWELARKGRGEKYSDVVQKQIDAALILGVNVLAYATNRELKGKEEGFTTTSKPQPKDQVRGRFSVARLHHLGGCSSAPRALVNLLDAAAGEPFYIRAKARDELLNITDNAIFDYHIVFMHGRTSFHFTDAERAQLKTYIERGGMLFADAICAAAPFNQSFRREMTAVFPDRKLEPIPGDDPIWTDRYGGFDLKTVERRDPQPRGDSGPLQPKLRKVPPEMEGIKIDDRWAVIFSPYDVSCALEKHDSLDCRGYVRKDAVRIGLNVILYSLQQ